MKEDKKGMESSVLGWWLTTLIAMIITLVGFFILKDKIWGVPEWLRNIGWGK